LGIFVPSQPGVLLAQGRVEIWDVHPDVITDEVVDGYSCIIHYLLSPPCEYKFSDLAPLVPHTAWDPQSGWVADTSQATHDGVLLLGSYQEDVHHLLEYATLYHNLIWVLLWPWEEELLVSLWLLW
jgi:hypothetical protein